MVLSILPRLFPPPGVSPGNRTGTSGLHLITDLLAKARHAATLACAPFSHFHLSADVFDVDRLLPHGFLFKGPPAN